jgi:L-iditol 2-dehydrogenase
VILGPGPIGLLSAAVSVAEGGFVTVIGTNRDRERLERARKVGAHRIINGDEENPLQAVLEATEGYGADVVLECSGAEAAASLGLELVRKRGKYTQMGLFGRPVTVDFEKVAFKELQVTGFVSQRRPAWKRALSLMARGVVDTELIISHEFPLAEWQEAFSMVEEKKAIKALLIP